MLFQLARKHKRLTFDDILEKLLLLKTNHLIGLKRSYGRTWASILFRNSHRHLVCH